jgi:thiol-disulfide isomerase/thioredoxin
MSRQQQCGARSRGWITALVLALSGCGDAGRNQVPAIAPPPAQTPTTPAETTTSSEAVVDPKPAESPGITLRDVDGDGFRAAVAAHPGKVVLVDMWATWCAPCLEKFPYIVELHRSHRDKGLVVISLSVDEPDARDAVLKFLTEQQAEFDNLLGTYGVGTEAIDAFEYGGDVPFYKLYDRKGTLRHQFSRDARDGIEPLENLDQRLAELLAEPE